MSIKTDIVEAPSHWACYLLYGDASGMDDAEIAACGEYFKGIQVLDCNPETERFTNRAYLFGSTSQSGFVREYTVVV